MKRISEENTFIVAILTESGATFNEEGVDYVHDWLAENKPELKNKAIIAMMGNMVYKPEQLAAVLEAHPDTYIIMSYEGGEYLRMLHYDSENILLLAEGLRNTAAKDPEATSWNIFKTALDEEN